MAQVTQDTLRLEILTEARDQYRKARNMRHATSAECSLLSLKIAECEAMMEEMLHPAPTRRDYSIDWSA
jgi:transcriptional regulator of met regulon